MTARLSALSHDGQSFDSIKLISVRDAETVYRIMLRTTASRNYVDNWMAPCVARRNSRNWTVAASQDEKKKILLRYIKGNHEEK